MSGYASDITVKVKLLPRNSIGVLPIASATEMSLATSSRYLKPYPPGNVKLNNLAYASWPTTTHVPKKYNKNKNCGNIRSCNFSSCV